MEITRTFDVTTVRTLLAYDDEVAEALGKSDVPSTSEHYYLVCAEGEEQLGLFVFHPKSRVTYQGHANMRQSVWGKRDVTETAGKKAIAWIFEHSPCERVIARVPHEYPQVQDFATRIGMREIAADKADRYYEIGKDGNT